MFVLVIPVSVKDIEIFSLNIPFLIKMLNPKQIIVIGSGEIKQKINRIENIEFIDENKMIENMSIVRVKEILRERKNYDENAGWYYQQFLKMAYAYICEDEKYIVWDCDTIPLNPIEFENDNQKSFFTMKEEYHPPYFDTMKKILGIGKTAPESFIAENMIIHKEIMLRMIHEIEANDKCVGTYFYEKILYAIDENNLIGSGFSEYETYGTYVITYFSGIYEMRKLRTFREGSHLYGRNPSEYILKQLQQEFDIISFEKW